MSKDNKPLKIKSRYKHFIKKPEKSSYTKQTDRANKTNAKFQFQTQKINIPIGRLVQLKNVHSLGVAAAPQVLRTHAERQTGDRDAPLDAPSEFVKLRPILNEEHPDYGALFGSGRDFRAVRAESQSCQRTVVRRDHYL